MCRLIFAGKQMNDDKMAKDYHIEGGSVLHLVGALCSLLNLQTPQSAILILDCLQVLALRGGN